MKNNNRRDFLKVSSLALAGAALGAYDLPFSQHSYPTKRLGRQLWSVRDAMVPDPAGTVKALGKMGYRNVEGFGYKDGKIFGLALKDFSQLLKDNGIK
ncbi:MAG: twin-arginine translocation signal domain-containing protein, partial [Bacteroidota bacterium]